MKYNNVYFGQVEAVFNKLGGMHGVNRFLSGQSEIKAIPKTFPIWRTVKIGMLSDTMKMWESMSAWGFRFEENIPFGDKTRTIRSRSKEMLNSPDFTLDFLGEEKEIDLALVTLADIGFKGDDPVTRKEVLGWAYQLGLRLCPHEVAIQLLYTLPGNKTDVHLVMKPISIKGDDDPLIFRIRKDGGAGGVLLDWNHSGFDSTSYYVFQLLKK